MVILVIGYWVLDIVTLSVSGTVAIEELKKLKRDLM